MNDRNDDTPRGDSPATMDITQVMELLPHRPPFLLVDRILEWESRKRCVGLKAVTIGEPFFAGHFPGHPVMPGVLILEALAQVGAVLLFWDLAPEERARKLVYFGGVDRARFRAPVFPGDVLRLEMTVKFPAGYWPERTWFGVHRRMQIAGPEVEAELSARAHPEGLGARSDREARTLSLSVEEPLVGFMYDIFWEK